ncbi:MAG TPA: hypothetical protein DDY91_20865, partial [Planctomycetaceae bacterium]|nr:hypothetical protein [Planctomycetaceae bacterium]
MSSPGNPARRPGIGRVFCCAVPSWGWVCCWHACGFLPVPTLRRTDSLTLLAAMQHSVLVIGVGSIGERHTRCFQNTGRARVSITEINPTLRQTIAQRYSVPEFPTLEAALQTPPDVAVVCTPAPFHVPMTRQLIAAGVHVLIEKPLGTTEAGLPELMTECGARPVTLGVAYVYRAFPEMQAARELLQSGELGAPLQLTVVGGQHFPTYRPAYREIYYARREMGGGAIQDALTHLLNLGEWLVGPIRRLVCDSAHQALPG